MDTGCDLLAEGLCGTTSDGVTPKYIDFIDCTGDGDIPMDNAKLVEFQYKNNGENVVEGLSGRKLVLGEWAKDVTSLKLAAIRLYELLPRGVLRRVKKERKEAFMIKHHALISKTQLKLDQLSASCKEAKTGDDEKKEKEQKEKEKKDPPSTPPRLKEKRVRDGKTLRRGRGLAVGGGVCRYPWRQCRPSPWSEWERERASI